MKVYQGINLHNGQKRILKEILDSKSKYNVINCSRQWGKSVFAMQLLLYFGINNFNIRVMYCTPYHAQAKKVYKKLIKSIIDSGIVKSHNKTDMTITLINGTEILFTGTEKYDNLRGDSIRYMIIDEFSYIREEAFQLALKPMLLSQKNSKCIIISTPKGKKNHFFTLSKFGMSLDQKNYSYHKGNYTENKYYDFSEIEDAKRNLPKFVFDQEYLAEFIDNTNEIFVNINDVFILEKYAKPAQQNYAGLDIGRQDDYTVLTILNQNGEIVEIYRDRKKSWDIIVGNVANILKKYNCSCLVETNGIGDVVYEMLYKIYKNIKPFTTTNSSKQMIIELLIVEFQNKTIQLPSKTLFKTLYEEINSLEYEYNIKTRTIKYGAATGHHDDCVMSLSLANSRRRNKNNIKMKFRG